MRARPPKNISNSLGVVSGETNGYFKRNYSHSMRDKQLFRALFSQFFLYLIVLGNVNTGYLKIRFKKMGSERHKNLLLIQEVTIQAPTSGLNLLGKKVRHSIFFPGEARTAS